VDITQIVVYEVLKIGRRLDCQAELSEEVRNRSEPADVLGVLCGRGEILVVRDQRQRVAAFCDHPQGLKDEGVRKLIFLGFVAEQPGLARVGVEHDRRLDAVDRKRLRPQRFEHFLHRRLVILKQLAVQFGRRDRRHLDPKDLVGQVTDAPLG
jgi:hypothetical protein